MGNTVTKVPLKDGTIRYFADAEVRQRVAELAQEAITQVETLPAPAASIVNQTFQYIGPTTENYVHNAFYTVVEGEEPGTYVYEQTVYTTQEINEIISGENLNNFRILYDDTEQPDTSAPATIELIDSIYRYTYVTIEEWTYGEDTTNITIYDGYNKPNAPTTIDGYNISLDGKTLTRIAATSGDVVIVKITGTRFGTNGVIIDLEDRVVDLENQLDGHTVKTDVPLYNVNFKDHEYDLVTTGAGSAALAYGQVGLIKKECYTPNDSDPTAKEAASFTMATVKGWDETVQRISNTEQDVLNLESEMLNIVKQYGTMPAPTAAQVGKIVQYKGPTDANYTNGYFYKCEAGSAPAIYEAPNGQMYAYKITSKNVNNFWYVCYSNQKIVFSKSRMNEDAYYPVGKAKYNSTDLICSLGSSSGTTTCNYWKGTDRSGNFQTPNQPLEYYVWWHGTDTPIYNNSFSCEASANPSIVIVDTDAEAFDYLYSSVYVWTRVDVQPAPAPYTLPIASDSTLGGIKVGNNLSIDENGVLSGTASYELPVATSSTLGGVKIGDNVNVDANGVISVAAPTSIKTVNSVSIGTVTTETEIASFPFYPTSVGNGDTLIINGLVSGLVAVTGLAAEITIKVKLDGTDYFTFKQTCDAGYVTIPVTCSIPMTSPAANHVATVTVTATDGSITL